MIPQEEMQSLNKGQTTNLEYRQHSNNLQLSINKRNLTIGIVQLLKDLNFSQSSKTLLQESSFSFHYNQKINAQQTLPCSLQTTPNKQQLEIQNSTTNPWNYSNDQINQQQTTTLQAQPNSLLCFLQKCQTMLEKDQFNTGKSRAKTQQHYSKPFYDIKKLFNAHFHTKKTHILPTNKVFCLQLVQNIAMTQASPNGETIAVVSKSSSIKIIKVRQKKVIKNKNLQKNESITALSWINNSLFVTGNSKGILKVYKNDLQLCKTFKTDESKITHIICSDNIIYAKSASKLSLATMQNGVFQDFFISDIGNFVKPKSMDCIIGISSDQTSVKIFDFKVKQSGVIKQINSGHILNISLSQQENSFFITKIIKKQAFIENYTMSGNLVRRISLTNKALNSLSTLSVLSVSRVRKDRSLYAITYAGSSKINYISQRSGNCILQFQTETEQQYVNKDSGLKISYLSQKQIIVVNNCCLNIYSQQKQVYKKIEANKVPKIPEQLAMFIRTLRDRHPQALNIELFQAILNQQGMGQQNQENSEAQINQGSGEENQGDFNFQNQLN